MPRTISVMEKDDVGSQDQEEAPTVVGPEGFVPHIVRTLRNRFKTKLLRVLKFQQVLLLGQ